MIRKNLTKQTPREGRPLPQFAAQMKDWVSGWLDPQKGAPSPEQFREEELLREIREVCDLLRQTQRCFQMTEDGDLLDSCIYQMEALNARYRYLLKQAKEAGLSRQPFLPDVAGEVPEGPTSGRRRSA